MTALYQHIWIEFDVKHLIAGLSLLTSEDLKEIEQRYTQAVIEWFAALLVIAFSKPTNDSH